MTGQTYTWLYVPLEFYDFPDDFEFGTGDRDDEVYEQAWNVMKAKGCVTVQFEGDVDPDELESGGAMLSRQTLPNIALISAQRVVEVRGLLNVLDDLKSRGMQAIFPTNGHAHIAAMMFGGRVLE